MLRGALEQRQNLAEALCIDSRRREHGIEIEQRHGFLNVRVAIDNCERTIGTPRDDKRVNQLWIDYTQRIPQSELIFENRTVEVRAMFS